MVKDAAWITMLLTLGACALVPDADKARISRAKVFQPPVSAQQCLAQLQSTGTQFAPLPDQDHGNGCTTINSVSISSLQGESGVLTATNLGPLTCGAANDFARWARFGADRAAREHLGSGIRRIETFGTYACRNVAGTGRRSAHARAAAIDVSGFVLDDGRRISVLEDWDGGSSAERQFLRAAQTSACEQFGNALGPDYNAAHSNHLHFESGGWRFCR